MDEILIGIITNAPNLAGLALLAWVLDRRYGDLLKMYGELLTKYHALVLILSDNKQITPAQMKKLMTTEKKLEDEAHK